AAENNNRAFAKTLLSYRADVNALHDCFSPLRTTAKYGSELVANLLLRGDSALRYSVANESFAVMNQLLQHPRERSIFQIARAKQCSGLPYSGLIETW
ncbi:hypothetical protein N7505_001301, partial [Penicillium chrysogenum]